MPHKIEISDKTYEELKEYCTLNHIKMGQYADKLLYDGLMIEKYGDVPFMNYKKKIVQEFPPAKFEQEYLAQPEPIHVDTPNPPETIETKFTLKPDGTVIFDGDKPKEESVKELEKIQEDIDNLALNKKEEPKIIRRRLK